MFIIRQFLVSVWMYEDGNPHKLVGLVEKPGQDTKWAFTSFDELLQILNPAESGRHSTGTKNNNAAPHAK